MNKTGHYERKVGCGMGWIQWQGHVLDPISLSCLLTMCLSLDLDSDISNTSLRRLFVEWEAYRFKSSFIPEVFHPATPNDNSAPVFDEEGKGRGKGRIGSEKQRHGLRFQG